MPTDANPVADLDRAAPETSRLRIEPLGERHASYLHPVLADPRIHSYIPDEIHPSVESLRARYARLAQGAPPGSGEVWLNWALRRIDTGTYIGTLQATIGPGPRAYVGYVLGSDCWRQGFATEACGWLVTWLRQRHAVEEILATVDVRNAGSIRVLEKLGFRCIGTEAAELRGEITSDFRYRLARDTRP